MIPPFLTGTLKTGFSTLCILTGTVQASQAQAGERESQIESETKAIMDAADKNGDNIITKDEFLGYLKKTNPNVPVEEYLDLFFDSFDRDKNGTISRVEVALKVASTLNNPCEDCE
ncbi:MAG: EF-hand domain-containing protein [bacterium]